MIANTNLKHLANYQIVYSNVDNLQLTILQNAGYDNDCCFNRYSAEKLQQEIHNNFGVILPVCLDSQTQESPCEILVGKTNRTQTNELQLNLLCEQNYVIVENTGKLVVCGGCYGETWQAVKVLCDSLTSNQSPLLESGVTKGFNKRGSVKLTTVALIGDSLTWGDKSLNPEYLSYPAFLQRMVWKNCIVRKYACCGKTMNDQIDYGYGVYGFTRTAEWAECLTDAEKFDYVFIMLGTNDAFCVNLSGCPWQANFQQNFVDSFLQILDGIGTKNAHAQFTLMNCPRVYAGGYDTATICNYQNKCVANALALGYNVQLYDTAFATQNLNSSIYYDQDKLHFNTKGYEYIANLVKSVLAQKIQLEI